MTEGREKNLWDAAYTRLGHVAWPGGRDADLSIDHQLKVAEILALLSIANELSAHRPQFQARRPRPQ
ncbi:hypothetical protein [Nocardia sp. NPDC049149]|uniref:hypothetical protein n=1 Tax=Nocardia sp. NPDC049149 TaxID=3364315 RepID=UPI00371288C2